MEQVRIVGVVTQGRYDRDHWVKMYDVQVSSDGRRWSMGAQKYLTCNGNRDRSTKRRCTADMGFPEVMARYVKLTVRDYHSWPAMRAALLTAGQLPERSCESAGWEEKSISPTRSTYPRR